MTSHRLQIWITVLSLAVVISFLVSAFVINEQRDIGRDSRARVCELADKNAEAIRAILINIRRRVAQAASTPEGKQEAFEFYSRQIELVRDFECDRLARP